MKPGYSYYCLNLFDGFYLEPMMEKLGAIFDICIRCNGIPGDQVAQAFVDSELAWQFEHQNPKYVAGLSGEELALILGERTELNIVLPDEPLNGFTPQFWLGQMLAYFQAKTAWPYRRIFEYLDYDRLEGLFLRHGEDDPEFFCEYLKALLAQQPFQSRLKSLRKSARLTQQELAEKSAVSLRSLQQYEQGAKSLEKASAETVRKLSLVLGCSMEELLG